MECVLHIETDDFISNLRNKINNFSSQNDLTLPREPGDDSRPDSVGKSLPGIEMLVSKELIRPRSSMCATPKQTRRIDYFKTRPN